MAEHIATIAWQRNNAVFTDNRYSRAHTWHFDGGLEVPAAASPHNVRGPFTNQANVDPEEAFVASLSSCHMLWFLSLAAKKGFVVESYRDEAVGKMGKNEEGREAMLTVELRPRIVFSGSKAPSEEDMRELHHEAHEACFIANSVKAVVEVNGGWEFVGQDSAVGVQAG